MTDEALFARLLENLSTQEEIPPSSELAQLSDLDHTHLGRFELVWNALIDTQRRSLISNLGQMAADQIEFQFDKIFWMALGDHDADVRRLAIENLWESEDHKLIPIYLEAVDSDPSDDVRNSAIQALGRYILLGQYGKIDADQLGLIEDSLLAIMAQEASPELQRCCIESLGFSSRPGVDEIIRAAYLSKEEPIRRSAILAMGRSANKKWADTVIEELNSHSPALRSEAARASGELEIRSAVGTLIELLEDVNDDVRANTIWSLGQIGGRTAFDALEAFQATLEGRQFGEELEEALEHIAFLEGTPDFFLHDYDDEEDVLD